MALESNLSLPRNMTTPKLSRDSGTYIDVLVEGIKESTGQFAIYAVQSFPRVIMDRLLARKW